MSHTPPEPNCLNCGAELQGKYCHACGQKGVTLEMTLHDLRHDVTHEFLHLDENKILKTARLLIFRPGFLSKEYVQGRRASYISPLRIYLTCSVLFFALAAFAPRGDRIIEVGPGPNVRAPLNAQQEAQADLIGDKLAKTLPNLMFFLMPAFGVLTRWLYKRQQRFYIPHLYFSVHLHAFLFLLLAVVALVGMAGRGGKSVGALLVLLFIPYYYVALRTFFGESWGTTAWKGTAIGFAYLFLTVGVLIALLAYTMPKLT